jgi:hypothetical protein
MRVPFQFAHIDNLEPRMYMRGFFAVNAKSNGMRITPCTLLSLAWIPLVALCRYNFP